MNWCYFGLVLCEHLDATQSTGLLFPWFEFIATAAIIFAVAEFAESSKTRLFLFHLSFLKSLMLIVILSGLILIAFSNFLPLIPGRALPFFGYPATYEAVTLILLSLLFVAFCGFLYRPYWFRPRFSFSFMKKLTNEMRFRTDKESLSSLIQLTYFYLDRIIKEASRDEYLFKTHKTGEMLEMPKLTALSRDFIDVILSKDEICQLIAREHGYFIKQFVKSVTRYKLGERRVGIIFFDNLSEKLLSDEGSLLAREQRPGGYEGIYQPISRLIFNSDTMMAQYRPLPMFYRGESVQSLRLSTKCLEVGLKHYFSTHFQAIALNSPQHFLAHTIEQLGKSTSSFVYLITDREDRNLWRTDTPEIEIIGNFFHNTEQILTPNDYDNYEPHFSNDELAASEETTTEGIAKGAFDFFEAFGWIKGNDEYVRQMLVIHLMWIFYQDYQKELPHRAIQEKFLNFVKERVTENLRGRYVSMIKMLINIYGYHPNQNRNPIQKYFNELFQNTVVKKLIAEEEFRRQHMPDRWRVKNGKIINSEGLQIFPVQAKINKIRRKARKGKI